MRFNSCIEMAHDLNATSQFQFDSSLLDCNENVAETQPPSQLLEKSVVEPSVLEAPIDLRPTDVSSRRLEYSYRPLDEIQILGPSYWNFRGRSKNPIRNSNDDKKKRKGRRAPQIVPNLIDPPSDDDVFIKITTRAHRKIATRNIKWNPERLLLPKDCGIDRNLFNSYQFRPGVDLSVGRAPMISWLDQNGSDREVIEGLKIALTIFNVMKFSFVSAVDSECGGRREFLVSNQR